MVTDVIDFHEVRTGERNDGTVYGMYSWARKLGQALAGGLSGWALGWIGFESTLGRGSGQSPAVLDGIYTLSTLVPALLLGLAGTGAVDQRQVRRHVPALHVREERHAQAPERVEDGLVLGQGRDRWCLGAADEHR